MNILERTTTEEYDEDGRLTSRTTVEKMDGGPVLPEPTNTLAEREPPKDDGETALLWHTKIEAALTERQYRMLALLVMSNMAAKWPKDYDSAAGMAEECKKKEE